MDDGKQHNFKVTLKTKDDVPGMLCYLAIFAAMCFLAFMMPDLLYITVAFLWTLLGLFIIIIHALFYVKVRGTRIQLRTRKGKKYEFDASQIRKISCYTIWQNRGPKFFLSIKTKTEEVELYSGMQGFGEMAGYLLQMLESGVIDRKAVFAKCKAKLVQYANGRFDAPETLKNKES